MTKYVLYLFFCASLISCNSTQIIAQENIQSVSYQKWVAGLEDGGSGVNFYVNLIQPLHKDIALISVHFHGQEALFEKTSETEYVAKIHSGQKDLIMDENPENEYGNQSAVINLKSNEAILTFHKNGETFTKKVENVKEKPIIAFPSRNKEKN
ncbi:hypothetical protein ACFSX9_08280 [Flavobacterium ardleyense]|uniref:Lipoprotein n=1 Tax=Flavobacterium ardleyense TaxID=2038737 RepID=A0ABW5Z780_9FLAO